MQKIDKNFQRHQIKPNPIIEEKKEEIKTKKKSY